MHRQALWVAIGVWNGGIYRFLALEKIQEALGVARVPFPLPGARWDAADAGTAPVQHRSCVSDFFTAHFSGFGSTIDSPINMKGRTK